MPDGGLNKVVDEAVRDIRQTLEKADPRLSPTDPDGMWAEIERRIRDAITPKINDAYGVGKAEGVRETLNSRK